MNLCPSVAFQYHLGISSSTYNLPLTPFLSHTLSLYPHALSPPLFAHPLSQSNLSSHTVARKLSGGGDDEVVASDAMRICILCPLAQSRLTFPCRSSVCEHVQCFDALTFLQVYWRIFYGNTIHLVQFDFTLYILVFIIYSSPPRPPSFLFVDDRKATVLAVPNL